MPAAGLVPALWLAWTHVAGFAAFLSAVPAPPCGPRCSGFLECTVQYGITLVRVVMGQPGC